VIGSKVGIRPVRKDGIRLEREAFQNKTIYHHYGHGSAGASISPGTAKLIIEKFEENYTKNQEIAVLGSGYAGLFTALFLSEKGYSVTIYSDNFYSKDHKEHEQITSQVAGGLWMPFGYSQHNNWSQHDFVSRFSFNYYK
jgi:glycine/D-amino acid oxidase-like deaminating enzyme